MQTSMAASWTSVDLRHAGDKSSGATVALMSYCVGIQNTEVDGRGWATRGGKLEKLRSDVENIFDHPQRIQIALFSDVGNMFVKLSDRSGGPHPTAEEIFTYIITDLRLAHIQVNANEPYVALIDTRSWQVTQCELIGDLCGKKNIVVQHLILEHLETGASMRCFNAYLPTSMAKESEQRTNRRKACILKMCSLATEHVGTGTPQRTASMPWIIAGDLNTAKSAMIQWCQPYVKPNVDCISVSGWANAMHARSADFALSQGIALKHVQSWVGRHSMPCASDAHDAVVVMGSLDLQHLHRQDRPSAWKRAIITLWLWFFGRCCCCCRYKAS